VHIDRIPLWLFPLVALVIAALWFAWRRGWLRLPLAERELVVLVMLRNSIELPAGQFIYGRF